MVQDDHTEMVRFRRKPSGDTFRCLQSNLMELYSEMTNRVVYRTTEPSYGGTSFPLSLTQRKAQAGKMNACHRFHYGRGVEWLMAMTME